MARTDTAAGISKVARHLGTTAAWGQLIADHPQHANALEAVATGTAGTEALNVELAPAAVELADPDRIADLTANDRRRTVADAATERTDHHSTPAVAHIAAQLVHDSGRVPSNMNRRSAPQRTRILEHVALHGLDTPTSGGADPTIDAHAAMGALRDLRPSSRYLTPVGADANWAARGRIVVAMLHFDSDDVSDFTLDDLAAGVAVLDELGDDPRHQDTYADEAALARRRAAAHTWCAGGTLDDVAATAGVTDLADIDDTTLEGWVDIWIDNLHRTTTNAILRAVTADGTKIRNTGDLNPLTDADPQLPAAVAFSLRGGNDTYQTAGGVGGTIATWLTAGSCDWDPTDVVALLDAHPDLAADVHATLNSSPDDRVGAELADANMTAAGLSPWVASPDSAAGIRLAAAADDAGFGPAEWSLVHRHLDEFRGTPEELIAMLTQVCH